MEDFKIDDVRQIKWLFLVAAAVVLVVYGFAMKDRALRAFAGSKLLPLLMPEVSRGRQIVKAVLLLAAMTCIVAALTGPRWGTYWEDVHQRQLDVMICLDVSRSMLAEDAGMSRMERAKDDIRRLLDRVTGGAVGLVAFAGKAELVCPLTDDLDFYRLALDDVGVHSVTLGGTNLGAAIAGAIKGFGEASHKQRVILLITDGEDQGGTATDEAKKARNLGINVFAIGIGDSGRGALIPIQKNGQRSYVQYDGEQVWSKANPAALKEIAAAGGGEYHPSGQVTPNERTLEWLYARRLRPQEEQSLKERRAQRHYARFMWPTAAALALLLIESMTSERLSRPRRESLEAMENG